MSDILGNEETMETMEGGGLSLSSGKSFLNHMSTITESDKFNMMNMTQYALLAIIPIAAVLKLFKMFIPLEDPTKGSLELSIEVVGQVVAIMVALFFVHKLVTYFPTYSKKAYESMNLVSLVLPLMLILLTLDTTLGDKVNILLERVMNALGIQREYFTQPKELNEQEEKMNTVNSCALNPVNTATLPPPTNTTPEIQNIAMPIIWEHNKMVLWGNSFMQDEVMASNSYGGYAFF